MAMLSTSKIKMKIKSRNRIKSKIKIRMGSSRPHLAAARWGTRAWENSSRTIHRRTKCMTVYKVGDIVSVEFPFSDLQTIFT